MSDEVVVWHSHVIQNSGSIIWVCDHLTPPGINKSLSLDEQRHYLETFDIEFHKGEFFILDHYMGPATTSESIVFFPVWLYQDASDYSSAFENYKIDFSKKKVAISCCSNKVRPHRLVTSCWLANQHRGWNYVYTQSWDQSQYLDQLDELLQIGNIVDWTHSFGPEVKMLPKSWMGTSGPNIYLNMSDGRVISEYENFNTHVKPIMDQSVFNLVLEASEWGKFNGFTEKYLNAVYSGTIPVTFGYGSYDILENMGLDSFRDILNTSGQYELNLVTRTWKILQDNADLFDHALDLAQDPQIQKRLQHNLDVVKDHHNWLVKLIVKCNNSTALDKFLKIQDTVEKQLDWKYIKAKKSHYKLLVNEIQNKIDATKTG